VHSHGRCCSRHTCRSVVVHEVECRHQVEVEVWPAAATAYFQDERFVNPIDTQVRFDAAIFNSAYWVTWEVKDLAGGPGAGTIDPSGLYTAPPKGDHPHGLTDLIVATTVEAPHRQAYARVTLIGFGPAPQPVPRLQIFPKQAYIYAPNDPLLVHTGGGGGGVHQASPIITAESMLNNYIDESNKQQRFIACVDDLPAGTSPQVEWLIDSKLPATVTDFFLVKSSQVVPATAAVVTARLSARHEIADTAKIYILNYVWPSTLHFP
jgi:hypothetical protein